MVEVETVGVQGQAAYGVVAIAILYIAAHGVSEVLHVHTYLVLRPVSSLSSTSECLPSVRNTR